jgi:hypothetical protein
MEFAGKWLIVYLGIADVALHTIGQIGEKAFDFLGLALDYYVHPSIRQVPHESRNRISVRHPDRRIAKSHPLHRAMVIYVFSDPSHTWFTFRGYYLQNERVGLENFLLPEEGKKPEIYSLCFSRPPRINSKAVSVGYIDSPLLFL